MASGPVSKICATMCHLNWWHLINRVGLALGIKYKCLFNKSEVDYGMWPQWWHIPDTLKLALSSC